MKILKTFSYNLFFFIFFIFIIEIFFGYCFDKNNLGPYMREHRMKKNDYTLKLMDKNQLYFTKGIIMDL